MDQGALNFIATVGGAVIVIFSIAFAKRFERRPPNVAPPDPAIGELRDELAALQERLDFVERVLAQKEQRERALSGKSDQL